MVDPATGYCRPSSLVITCKSAPQARKMAHQIVSDPFPGGILYHTRAVREDLCLRLPQV